ncbi:uncharacterized protein LOC134242903 [Saccostrea cucullata]|uniref:uncharacterized protein LOC134242903 n=1 Tax=Saccostrea cuccullata TaxID=36930 RepID=UPI002ED08470
MAEMRGKDAVIAAVLALTLPPPDIARLLRKLIPILLSILTPLPYPLLDVRHRLIAPEPMLWRGRDVFRLFSSHMCSFYEITGESPDSLREIACVGEHMISDQSKKHEVVTFQSRKSTLLYPRCEVHTDNSCEFHCKECNILICSACIVSKNHKVHDIHFLKDILAKKKAEIEKEIHELEESIHPTYQDIASDVQNRMNSTDIFEVFNFQLDSKKYRILPPKLNITMAQFSPFSVQERISEVFGKIIPTTVSSDNHGYSLKAAQGLLGAEMSPLQENLTEAGSSPPVKRLLDEPETVTTIYIGYGDIYNVACLSDEEIWTHGTDNTMKLYSINQGSVLKSITTKYITENRNLDICVSDNGAEALVVVNQGGKLKFMYTGHTPAPKNKPFNPRGITTDSQSHILTADHNNDCVHIIDQDGQFLRFVHCGLSFPYGLCTDTNDNLYIAHQFEYSHVKKIKYQK